MTKAETLYFKPMCLRAALYVQELETDEHYVLSGEKYPVAFEYAGQDTAKVEIKVNGGEPIENNLKYGKISGWKVDQDGFGLGGSKIGLFRAGETEFTEETALMVTESNPIGYFEFNKVPAGSWEIHEIAPPKAFVLNEESFPAEITEDGETIEITIQNQIIRGTVETTKADADYPENKLTGALFEVYADVDSNGEFNPDIDLLAGELAESDPGHYQLKDLVYGGYFLHEQKAPEFFEKDDGYYPFSITENGAVVRVETKAGAGFFKTQAQTGTLKIVKTADDDKIADRKFLVTGTAYAGGEYEQEFQTDEKGEISVTLRVGKYTVSELPGEDAAAYELPSGQTVEIKAGETRYCGDAQPIDPERDPQDRGSALASLDHRRRGCFDPWAGWASACPAEKKETIKPERKGKKNGYQSHPINYFMRRHFRRPCVPAHSKPQEEMRKLGGAPQSAPPIILLHRRDRLKTGLLEDLAEQHGTFYLQPAAAARAEVGSFRGTYIVWRRKSSTP